ncbi:MAG TPA: hypothetical protein VJ302_35490, partial [Blastocatellia bacterium]|nr:hypothetical protein [Blastocatellia bacterium]
VVFEVFRRNGRDIYLGHKLPAYFIEAGLGSPDGTDVSGLIGPIAQYGAMLRGVYLSLLPRALQMGLTTEAESRAFLEELTDAEQGDRHHSVLPPLLIGAWKRKPME